MIQETEYRIRKEEDNVIKEYIASFETEEEAMKTLQLIAGDHPIDGKILRFEENDVKYEYVVMLCNKY